MEQSSGAPVITVTPDEVARLQRRALKGTLGAIVPPAPPRPTPPPTFWDRPMLPLMGDVVWGVFRIAAGLAASAALGATTVAYIRWVFTFSAR